MKNRLGLADRTKHMWFLDQVSTGMVYTAPDGRRVFCHGIALMRKRCVYVTAQEERDLRSAFGWGFLTTILAFALSNGLAPFWLRLLVGIPIAMGLVELNLRRMTGALPAAAIPPSSFGSINKRTATEAGTPLLWFQLAFFVAMTAGFSSSFEAVSYESLGWRKYAGIAIGIAMTAQVTYQLLSLRKKPGSRG